MGRTNRDLDQTPAPLSDERRRARQRGQEEQPAEEPERDGDGQGDAV